MTYAVAQFVCLLFLISTTLAGDKDSPIYAVVHKTLAMTARSCMVSANASEVDLESLREDPPFPEKSACILTCLLEKVNHDVASCELANEITSCIYKYAPELHFKH
ncbi:unnamed protein product [Danaus chrysippus]|uniref:(African queen) hypothetical protein n=1 Tax=Danaus chrysippus TaxID=151541 RepID=A0A8J2QWH3_9NEOP|nr:unnamed protein product [Danaus chrysippus]